jgi:hypothetical protein
VDKRLFESSLGFSWEPTTISLPHEDKPGSALIMFEENKAEFVWNSLGVFENNPSTLPQTKTILQGESVESISLDLLRQVKRFDDATNFLIRSVRNAEFRLDMDFLKQLHAIVGREEVVEWDKLRSQQEHINGVSHIPSPAENGFFILREQVKNPIERAIATFLFISRTQFFFDCDKRTALLMMNGVLLSAGYYPITVQKETSEEFNDKLRMFYNFGEANNMFSYFKNTYAKLYKEKPVFYLLDRNAYILMERYKKGEVPDNDPQWTYAERVFSDADKEGNTISIMLSIMEGKPADNHFSRQRYIIEEAEFLKSFIKKAKTDAKSLEKLADFAARLDLGKHEYSFASYLKFYNAVCDRIAGGVRKDELLNVENYILSTANNIKISARHPLVITSLSALYGGKIALGVLKFKKGKKRNPYNALSDIMFLTRSATIYYHLKNNPHYSDHRVQLLTFDKNLLKWLCCFTLNKVSKPPVLLFSNALEFNFSIAWDTLFSQISDEHLKELQAKVGLV